MTRLTPLIRSTSFRDTKGRGVYLTDFKSEAKVVGKLYLVCGIFKIMINDKEPFFHLLKIIVSTLYTSLNSEPFLFKKIL